MNRRFEATLSRQNMSKKKTIYVEGDLDYSIIEILLQNNCIANVHIYKIIEDIETIEFGNYSPDTQFGAKKLIVDFINNSNNDSTIQKGKYLGIVDLDYDLCFDDLIEIDNLIYTDKNSMESYLIDFSLFKGICLDYKIEEFTTFEENFNNYIENMKSFNIMFSVQLNHYEEFGENLISFDDIPLNCTPFIKDDYSICSDSMLFKCNGDKQKWNEVFNSRKEQYNTLYESCKENILNFLHGKHTLRYIIAIFKKSFGNFKTVSDDMIINILKDKFILSLKTQDYPLFYKVLDFSKS